MNSNENTRLTQSSKSFFKTLQRLHLYLVMGVVLFLSITIYLVESGGFGEDDEINNVFQYVVPLLATVSIFASRFMFNKRRKSLSSAKTLQDKTEGYQAALIVRWALIQGATLFAIIAFMLTSNYGFATIAIIMILYQILQRPNLESALEDLNLSHGDFGKVRDPESIIFDRSKSNHESK